MRGIRGYFFLVVTVGCAALLFTWYFSAIRTQPLSHLSGSQALEAGRDLRSEEITTHASVRSSVGLKTKDQKTFIFVNAYQRSGSSFTTELLGVRNDTVYFYEPIRSFTEHDYYSGRDIICSLHSTVCRSKRNAVADVLDTMSNIYKCTMPMVKILDKFAFVNSGGTLNEIEGCFKGKQLPGVSKKRNCSRVAIDICSRATYRVIKVIRITVDNLEPLLIQHQELKVMHLFRDPRAIINSRRTTGWYPTKFKTMDEVDSNAESLCRKMAYDFEHGLRLAKKYPGRFVMMRYEDLVADIPLKTQQLFKFFGIPFTAEDKEKIQFLTQETTKIPTRLKAIPSSLIGQNSFDKRYTTWWRKALDMKTVSHINNHCKSVCQDLGYPLYESEGDLRNSSYAIQPNKNFI